MDPRHSRYFRSVIGNADVEADESNLRLVDRRTEGNSELIRTRDLETVQANQEAIRLGHENLEWRIKLAEMLVAFNATSDAIEQIDAVLAANPDHADALVLRAIVLARKGNLEEALPELDRAASTRKDVVCAR